MGIIPANTGRIDDVLVDEAESGDHPREYGENTALLVVQVPVLGSSPRIRGE